MIRLLILLICFTSVLATKCQNQPKNNLTFISAGDYNPERHVIVKRLSKDIYIIRSDSGSIDPKVKLAPHLIEKIPETDEIWVKVLDVSQARQEFKKLDGAKVLREIQSINTLQLSINEQVFQKILESPNVIFIDHRSQKPNEESLVRNHDLGVNDIYISHRQYGKSGVNVAVKERSFDPNDLDIKKRVLSGGNPHPEVSRHATDMATLISGMGYSFKTGGGVSEGHLISSSFENLFPEPSEFYSDHEILIENNSYGVGVENYYGLESEAYDTQVNVLHVFSAGNLGSFEKSEGTYMAIDSFANLTGTFKQAKNNLVVGAIDEYFEPQIASSSGPAYDGRIKPEVVAYGADGSSDAAAIVSGISSSLSGYSLDRNGQTLTPSDLKSLIIGGARDVGNTGPDYKTGYGSASLERSQEIIEKGWAFSGSLSSGEVHEEVIFVPENVHQIKVVLAWSDPPGNPGDYKALINDLDLEVWEGMEQHLPWVLSSSPVEDSLRMGAKKGVDELNNIEVVDIHNPNNGDHLLRIRANDLINEQAYSIAYYIETDQLFRWTYPLKENGFEAGSPLICRWNSTSEKVGNLYYRFPSSNWQLAGSDISLIDRYYQIHLPDTASPIQFSMQVEDSTFQSDWISINPLTNPQVDLLCDDQVRIKWNALPGIGQYAIYQNDDDETTLIINDTILSLSSGFGPNVSIQPIFGDTLGGLRGYSLNYQNLGGGCYLDDFFVYRDVSGDAFLNLTLNAFYEIAQITIIKNHENDSSIFLSFIPTQNDFQLIDSELMPGVTKYEAIAELSDGTIFRSGEIEIYGPGQQSILYPNPSYGASSISVITPFIGSQFTLYNSEGSKIYQQVIDNDLELIDVSTIRQGIYFFRVMSKGKISDAGKIIIYK